MMWKLKTESWLHLQDQNRFNKDRSARKGAITTMSSSWNVLHLSVYVERLKNTPFKAPTVDTNAFIIMYPNKTTINRTHSGECLNIFLDTQGHWEVLRGSLVWVATSVLIKSKTAAYLRITQIDSHETVALIKSMLFGCCKNAERIFILSHPMPESMGRNFSGSLETDKFQTIGNICLPICVFLTFMHFT